MSTVSGHVKFYNFLGKQVNKKTVIFVLQNIYYKRLNKSAK
jgi:hypothetical protein